MLPRLYSPSTSVNEYNTNGLGFIKDCLSCEVTEARNADYYLEATVATHDKLAEMIKENMLIKAKANDIDPPQLFEINKIVPSSKGKIQIYAQHIKFLAFQNYVVSNVDYADDSGTPQQIINTVFSRLTLPNYFTFQSNISTQGSMSFVDAPSKTLGEIFGGSANSLLSTFDGEFHYDNFRIEFLAARGADSGHRIAYGHNLSDAEQTITNDASYSHIVGYAKVSRSGSQNGYVILTSDPVVADSNRVFPKIKLIDFTEDMRTYFGSKLYISAGTFSPGDAVVKAKINELTQQKYNEEYKNIVTTDRNIKITYRPELDRLTNLSLCDTVTVVPDNREAYKAKVSKVKYDSLAERYNSIEIGDAKPILSRFLYRKRR